MSSGIVETSQSGSEQQPQQPISRTRLVQKLLAATASLPNFIHDLVYTQATVVAGTEAAAFLIEPAQDGSKGFNLKAAAHIRPDDSDPDTRAAALAAFQDIMKPCVQQGKDGAIQIDGTGDGSDSQYCLVTLLRSEGNVVAASAVITRARDLERAQKLLTPMQLVAGYFELYALRRTSEQHKSIAQSHQHVLQLQTSVATSDGFESGAMNLCNELAARTGASRVAMGWVKQEKIKLTALSHTEEFDKKQELSVQIVKVMEECLDNDEIVQYEPDGTSTNTVTREAAILSRTQGGEAILSLPLRRKGEVVGVITLEFPANQKIGPQAATGLAVAVELLAPQLYDRYQNDRWLITKAGLSLQELGKKATGPKHMLAKTIIFVVFLTLLFVTVYTPMYHVTGSFTFTPMDKRSISAPFDGQLKEVKTNPKTNQPYRPGDAVTKGTVIAEFQTYDLLRELGQAKSEEWSRREEAKKYAADVTKAAEAQIADLQADAAKFHVELLQSRIAKAMIVADIDGEIIQGDLRNKINAPFKQGDPIMEIVNRDSMEVQIAVNDRDIQEIKVGSKGMFATVTEPTQKFPMVVSRIVPLGQPKEATNTFPVFAVLDRTSPKWTPELEAKVAQWSPGLAGEAKVEVDKRSLGWIWIHRSVEWLHFWWWKTW